MQQLFSQKEEHLYIPMPKGRGFTAYLVNITDKSRRCGPFLKDLRN